MESSSSLGNISKEKSQSQETLEKYKEIISTLPQNNGWKLPLPLCKYQGFWYMQDLLEAAMFAQENFNIAQPNCSKDVILLCSAPKTDTTWLKSLAFSIATRTRFYDSTNSPLLTKLPHDCIPFLEIDILENPKNIMHDELGLPIWSTHIPYSALPKNLKNPMCKIVYICRDPKDAFVSTWHFHTKITKKLGKDDPVTLEEAFELYCKGIIPNGPYWDHVLDFWKTSSESPNKVLFLKYEDMMGDPIFYVRRLAEFMGFPFSVEEEKEGEVERIMNLCSFENLSNLEVNKTGEYHHKGTVIEHSSFFRKGKVGDWKNILTLEMSKRLDSITVKKLSGSGLKF